MEESNLSETEFRIMVIRMLNELLGRMDEHNENLNREIWSIKKDIETIKKNQTDEEYKNWNEEYTRESQQ